MLTTESSRVNCRTCGTHDVYCCGARVTVSDKKVSVKSRPVVANCPLHESMYGVKEISTQTVQASVEGKVCEFGFCCKTRRFNADPIVAYGASEMMSFWLENGMIDRAVVVCDGAGTVITRNGRLVQGIGARLTGIIKTSPIRQVIKHIERNGGEVLEKTTARIDQVAGVRRAFDTGSARVAVSVASFQANAVTKIRDLERRRGEEVVVFSVCNTLAKDADVKHIEKADIVCASASKILRNKVAKNALLQVGMTIPVYALTQKGKELVLAYLASFNDKLVVFRTQRLPYDVKNKGPRLRARSFSKQQL